MEHLQQYVTEDKVRNAKNIMWQKTIIFHITNISFKSQPVNYNGLWNCKKLLKFLISFLIIFQYS